MQHGESMCHSCCDICPSFSPFPFATLHAGLAYYRSGNLGCGEIGVILGSLLLKVEDWIAAWSLPCNPGQEHCVSVGEAVSWSCHGVGCCSGCVQIREYAESSEGAVRQLWGCVFHPSQVLQETKALIRAFLLLSSQGGRQFFTLGCDRTAPASEEGKSFLGCNYFIYEQ